MILILLAPVVTEKMVKSPGHLQHVMLFLMKVAYDVYIFGPSNLEKQYGLVPN